MPYVQNTKEDREEMLAAIGVGSIDSLFECIPESVRFKGDLPLQPALSEPEMMAHIQAICERNQSLDELVCFLGAGIYDHYIPPVVDFVSGRSEFYTSYTPYQAEASQGNLQVFYEYQTLICNLTGMDVANASLYDGASALAESVLMAQNIVRNDRIMLSGGVHPEYAQTLKTHIRHLNVPLHEIPINETGSTDLDALQAALKKEEHTGVVVVQQPNFFGIIEDLSAAATIAHESQALLVVCINPIAMGILKPPGDCEADVVCGEGQCLGIPPSFGGPCLGILATRDEYVRKIPGRLVGQTRHEKGDRAFVLTLQTREQHIRRERATSNICTNHALLALRATVYLSALGKQGLAQVATLCTQKSHALVDSLTELGHPPLYSGAFFNEFVIDCGRSANSVVDGMLAKGYLAGLALGRFHSTRENQLLLCVTEQRTKEQIEDFANKLGEVIRET